MIKLLLILLPFTAAGQLQCPPSEIGKIDTIPFPYIVADKARKYNYYNPNGSLAWGGVNEYDQTLVPGGRIEVYFPVGTKFTLIMNGWKVTKTDSLCNMKLVKYLDNKKKIFKQQPFDIQANLAF